MGTGLRELLSLIHSNLPKVLVFRQIIGGWSGFLDVVGRLEITEAQGVLQGDRANSVREKGPDRAENCRRP
jgi:hypothetical protein